MSYVASLGNFIVKKNVLLSEMAAILNFQSTKRTSARSKCIILHQDLSVGANLSILL